LQTETPFILYDKTQKRKGTPNSKSLPNELLKQRHLYKDRWAVR